MQFSRSVILAFFSQGSKAMWLKCFFPLVLFTLLAPFTPSVDLAVSHAFFRDGHFCENVFFRFLFVYGEKIGFLTAGAAAFMYFFSFFNKKFVSLRKDALLMILAFVIGAGLIAHTIFKDNWGRPRPKQIIEFGGKHEYLPFWIPNFSSKQTLKSFPSGHAAMGCYYLSLCFIGRRKKNRLLFSVGLFLTLFFGLGLMIGRVAQGGHFVSDVLASFVLMWTLIFLLDHRILHGWHGIRRFSRK